MDVCLDYFATANPFIAHLQQARLHQRATLGTVGTVVTCVWCVVCRSGG